MSLPRITWTRARAAQELEDIAIKAEALMDCFERLFYNADDDLRSRFNSADEFGLDLDGLRQRAIDMAAALREAERRELLNATTAEAVRS